MKPNTSHSKVYLLYRDYVDDQDSEHSQLLGVFSTERNALQAKAEITTSAEVSVRSNEFQIWEHPIDYVEWLEGFGVDPPQDDTPNTA